MTARIRTWHARNLSYLARLQLVNSVLMSISNYWSQTIVLPKRTLRLTPFAELTFGKAKQSLEPQAT